MDHEFHSKIAGVTFDCPVTGIPRQEIIRKYIRPGMTLTPITEPNNEYSDTAVALWLRHDGTDYHVGYFNDKVSREVFAALQQSKSVSVRVSNVTGGTSSKKELGVNVLVGWDDKPGRSPAKTATKVVADRPGFLRQNWVALVAVAILLSCLACWALSIPR